MKIKFGIRHNLFYPIVSIIFTFLRKVETIAMNKSIGFDGSLLLTLIMFSAEIIPGMILYLYQKSFIKEGIEKPKLMGIALTADSGEPKKKHSRIKIYILLILIGLIDFFEFIIDTLYFPKYDNISNSLFIRLRCILTIFSAIFSHFILKFSLFNHQKVSLIVIFICLIITLISEIFYEGKEDKFLYVLFFIFANYFADSFFDIIEKYLLDTCSLNPFKILMIEGIFGFIFASIYTVKEDPFKEYNDIKEKSNKDCFILIIFLILYFILCAGRNVYRIITNKLYFPITRSLTDSLFDPLFIIYYYCFEKDFYLVDKDKQSPLFFGINLIVSIIFVFFGCVYNEVFVLFCFNLEYNTHIEISRRASSIENENIIKSKSPDETAALELGDLIIN